MLFVQRLTQNLIAFQTWGIIVPVPQSKWATPALPVATRIGCVRLCSDFKLTVNEADHTEQYPFARVENILATLMGGEVFTTIYLREVYNQLPLDETAVLLVTISTARDCSASLACLLEWRPRRPCFNVVWRPFCRGFRVFRST